MFNVNYKEIIINSCAKEYSPKTHDLLSIAIDLPKSQ